MEPESLVSLLLLVSLFGLAGLGVAFFLYRKKNEERYQKLATLLDSLDERSIHESSAFEKKNELIRAAVIKQQEVFKEEHQLRVEAETEILESLDQFRKLVEDQWIAGLQSRIEETKLEQQKVGESMDFYGKKIESVRFRNEIQMAYSLLRSGESGQAIDLLDRLLGEEGSDKEVRLLLTQSLMEGKRYDKARSTLEEGLAIRPGDPDLLARLAHLHWLEGRIPEMARSLTDGLVREPNHNGLLFERSLLSIHQRKFDSAVVDLEKILDSGVESAEIRYNLGMALVSLGKISAAIRELRQSVSMDPLSAQGNHALGLALLSGHRFKESRDFLERAREYDPQNVSIRLDLSIAYRLTGAHQTALDEASVALELDPHSERAVLEKALAHHALSQLREALETLDRFLLSHPTFIRARSLKAAILQETERFDEAVVELRHLTQLDPENSSFHTRLGEALKRSGDPRQALEVIEFAAKKSPDAHSIQLMWAKECLLQHQFDKLEGITTYILPKIENPKYQLQFIEIRMLHALKVGKLASLIKILDDLKRILDRRPELIPIEEGLGIREDELLGLALDKKAKEIHYALLDLFSGEIDFQMLDDSVTQVMKSLLPPSKKAAAHPVEIAPPPAPPSVDSKSPVPVVDSPLVSSDSGVPPEEISQPQEISIPTPTSPQERETASVEEATLEPEENESPGESESEESPTESERPSEKRKKRRRKSARKGP